MIVDAGPLLALFNPADRHHQACVAFLRGNEVALVTTWPVLTEVMHLLRYSVDAQAVLGDALAVAQAGGAGVAGAGGDLCESVAHGVPCLVCVVVDCA